MATIIRVAGADFSANPVGFMPPVAANLKAWHYLGGSLANSARNLAPGGAAGSAVGSPTVEASHLRLDETGFIQTGVVDDGEATLLAVAKMPTGWAFSTGTAAGYMLSSYNSNGRNLIYRKSGSLPEPAAVPREVMYRDSSGTPTYQQLDGTAVSDATAWQFFSAKANATSATLTNKTTGVVNTAANPEGAGALIGSGVSYRIGSSPGGVVDPIDIAFAAIYDRALTADEETAIYATVKAYLARRFTITI